MVLLIHYSDQTMPFPTTFSNPPRGVKQFIYIAVYRGKHVTHILPINWFYTGKK